jgi:selenide,water dikinase
LEHMTVKTATGNSSATDNLMLGFETNDDAAVYRLSDNMAALLTVDFFTPIVDDPYDFGRITAANALSDIYAMGGKPLTAMNLLAFPCSLGPEVVGEVLRGGAEKVVEAGAVIVGGHTIDDSEPKYGLSVMGMVHPDRVLYNRGALAGDVLVLTKPLGTGLWGTALKRELYTDTHPQAKAAIEMMARLNATAAEAIDTLRAETGECVHACTDVTGFGLAGHLHEMALASDVAAVVELDALPLLDGAWDLSTGDVCPGRTADLVGWACEFATFKFPAEQGTWEGIVCDPQTSGGLLLAMPAAAAERYLELCASAAIIGTVETGESGALTFI